MHWRYFLWNINPAQAVGFNDFFTKASCVVAFCRRWQMSRQRVHLNFPHYLLFLWADYFLSRQTQLHPRNSCLDNLRLSDEYNKQYRRVPKNPLRIPRSTERVGANLCPCNTVSWCCHYSFMDPIKPLSAPSLCSKNLKPGFPFLPNSASAKRWRRLHSTFTTGENTAAKLETLPQKAKVAFWGIPKQDNETRNFRWTIQKIRKI